MFEDVGKRQVFVGSSSEGKNLADIVITELKAAGLHPLAWFDFFKNQRPPIQELEQISLRAHGAVLVATSDDRAIIRNQRWTQARDNVLFEYGLFSGSLGRSKCGLLVPDQPDFRIPSDFLGVACFSSYTSNTVSECVAKLVGSLGTALARPAMAETLASRSRRILCLIGWVREETFRLIEDWDSVGARGIISERLKAVSGFLQQDIDALQLRQEYDAVEGLVIDAVNRFPSLGLPDFREHQRYVGEDLLRGRYPANREVLYGLLHSIPSELRHECSCTACRYFWDTRRGRWDWPEPYWRDRYYYGSGPSYPYPCCATLWAIGVAEASTAFEEMIGRADPIAPLRDWADKKLPPLNKAIVAFERRIHERLFGSLDTGSTATGARFTEATVEVPETPRAICRLCHGKLGMLAVLRGQREHQRCPDLD